MPTFAMEILESLCVVLNLKNENLGCPVDFYFSNQGMKYFITLLRSKHTDDSVWLNLPNSNIDSCKKDDILSGECFPVFLTRQNCFITFKISFDCKLKIMNLANPK